VGRFGGDEFYILMDTVDKETVEQQFSLISGTVDEEARKYGLEGVITISGGYVRVPDDFNRQEYDAVDIVKLADVGLYHSKAFGKHVCSDYIDVKSKLDEIEPENSGNTEQIQ
jgi:GGDEF domain-containing protein